MCLGRQRGEREREGRGETRGRKEVIKQTNKKLIPNQKLE